MMKRRALVGCLVATACRGASPTPREEVAEETDLVHGPVALDIDRDDDGSVPPLDCDDHDPTIYPGSPAEVCGDGIAHDCGDGPACRYAGEWSLANARTITGTVEGEVSGELIVGGGDLNGDGLADFVSMALGDRSLSIVYGPAEIATFAEAGATIPDTYSQWLAPVAAGDLDGDGNDDLLVSTTTGSYLLAGPLAGTVIAPEAATAAITVTRMNSGAGVGDWNGDGINDLAWSWGQEPPRGSFGVFLGPLVGEVRLEQAAFQVEAMLNGDQIGRLAGAGDVDGDGLGDVLSANEFANFNGDYTGAVSLFLGGQQGDLSIQNADARLLGVNPMENAGWSYDAAGDVNADGYGDILVGSRARDEEWSAVDQAAIASLVYGPVYGVVDLDHADARYECDTDPIHCSGDVRGAGDMDGDGFDDFAVSNPSGWRRPGAHGGAWLFYGPVEGHHTLAVADAALVGELPIGTGNSMDGVGDVDGDGLDDLVIGARGWRSTPELEIWAMGGAYVVFGGDL